MIHFVILLSFPCIYIYCPCDFICRPRPNLWAARSLIRLLLEWQRSRDKLMTIRNSTNEVRSVSMWCISIVVFTILIFAVIAETSIKAPKTGSTIDIPFPPPVASRPEVSFDIKQLGITNLIWWVCVRVLNISKFILDRKRCTRGSWTARDWTLCSSGRRVDEIDRSYFYFIQSANGRCGRTGWC